MEKRIVSRALILFLGIAISMTPTVNAVNLKSMGSFVISFVKNYFTGFSMKSAAITTARVLWRAAQIGTVATVLGNICMPLSVRDRLKKSPFLGRFVFKREKDISTVVGSLPPLNHSPDRPNSPINVPNNTGHN